MSRENVAVVRALYGALSRGDLDAAASNLGAEVEWDTRVRGSDGALDGRHRRGVRPAER